jgi:hypothetical protein
MARVEDHLANRVWPRPGHATPPAAAHAASTGAIVTELYPLEAVLAALFAGVAIGGAVVYAVMHHGGPHS